MENTRPVVRIHKNLNGQSDRSRPGPLDVDSALGFVHQVLDVRTHLGMDRNPFTPSDIAHDSFTPNRIAALSAIDEYVICALDVDCKIPIPSRRVRRGRRWQYCRLVGLCWKIIRSDLLKHLAGRVFSETERCIEIFGFADPILGSNSGQFILGYAVKIDPEPSRFLLERLLPDLYGLCALGRIDHMLDPVARTRRSDQSQPIAARLVTGLG